MVGETSPSLCKLELGETLERFRTRAGLERADAAATLHCSPGKIRTIEVGEVSIRPAELRDLLDLYGVTGVVVAGGYGERATVTAIAGSTTWTQTWKGRHGGRAVG